MIPYPLASGILSNSGAGSKTVWKTTVTVPGAPSLQLLFDTADLQHPDDAIVVTNPRDGEQQRLTLSNLKLWRNHTAWFNGDRLELSVELAAGSVGQVVIRDLYVGALGLVGQHHGNDPLASICAGIDDRVPSSDPRVCRLVSSLGTGPAACTGFLISDTNTIVSAGHCYAPGPLNPNQVPPGAVVIAEFNVPLSLPVSNPGNSPPAQFQHPPVADQYPVDQSSIWSLNNGIGADWLVGRLHPNSTGQTAVGNQGAHFTLATTLPLILPPPNNPVLRLTGFGVDANDPAYWCAQQTATGPLTAYVNDYIEHLVDSAGGASGAPMINEATGEVIGIHTHGGCALAGYLNNHAQSILTPGLQIAISNTVGCSNQYLASSTTGNSDPVTCDFQVFNGTPAANSWVGFGITSASDWDLIHEDASSTLSGGSCDFIIANGHLGTVAPTSGEFDQYVGTDTARADLLEAQTLTVGTMDTNTWGSTDVMQMFEFESLGGYYEIAVSGSPDLSWRLYKPGSDESWRARNSTTLIASGTVGDGASNHLLFDAGWHVIVVYKDNGTAAVTPSTFGVTVCNGSSINLIANESPAVITNATPCREIGVNPVAGRWNVVGVSSSSNWNLVMGSATSTTTGADFVLANGHHGAISPTTGLVIGTAGSADATVEAEGATALGATGFNGVDTFSPGEILELREINLAATGTYAVTVTGDSSISWRLYAPQSDANWIRKNDYIGGGTASGTTWTVTVSSTGYHALLLYRNNGPSPDTTYVMSNVCPVASNVPLSGISVSNIGGPCHPFTTVTAANRWNAVGVASTSDWNIGVGSAQSGYAFGLTDYVITNGHLGAINPQNGVAVLNAGAAAARLQRADIDGLPVGTTLSSSWPASFVIRMFDFNATTAGSYDITLTGSSALYWKLHAPGNDSQWRPSSDFVINGVANGTTHTVTLDAGWHAIAVTHPFGAPASSLSFQVRVDSIPGSNPLPTLTSIAPTSATVGGGTLTLTANGSNFVSGAMVHWSGTTLNTPLATTFVSTSQLTASVPSSLTATVGTAAISIENPAPGGGFSPSQTLLIGHPTPSVTGMFPSSTTAGSGSFSLDLLGSGFNTSSVIRWNGLSQPTTLVLPGLLRCTIPASYVATAGTHDVEVFNPSPGGGTSASTPFTVTFVNPVPTLTSVTPDSSPVVTPAGGIGPEQVIATGFGFAWDVHAADLDGDGDNDILGTTVNAVRWCENLGGSFGAPQNVVVHAGTYSHFVDVHTGDLDNDGDLDVLSVSLPSNQIAWYENLGGGSFGAPQVITSNLAYAYAVHAADLDGDGDLDVLSASRDDNKIAWYENIGGSFGPQHLITSNAMGAMDVFTADLDGDGDADVLSASQGDNRITWYENFPWGFGTPQTITTNAQGARSVFAADLDGDGDVDVLSASQGDDKIAWYENLGGSFGTQQVISSSADGAVSVFAADLDGDGDRDVLSASRFDDKIAWYENLGGSFGPENVVSTTADYANNVFASDLNGDGDLDILSLSLSTSAITWYENTFDPLQITVSGSGFVADSTVKFDGTTLTTTFEDGNTLKALVGDNFLTTTGTAAVLVESPLPGGGTSASLPFIINNFSQATGLTTTFASNNGQAGNMFDLVAINDVSICGFDVNLDVGTWDLEVYGVTGGGTFVGNETNSSAWTLIGSAAGVVSNGLNAPTPLPISLMTPMTAGTTQGFYVTVTNGSGIKYTNGTTAGAVYAADSNLQILEGAGKTYPFGSTYSPRVWNGTVHYSPTALQNTTLPTAVPVSVVNPCSPFSFTLDFNRWNAVGCASTSDWDIGIGGVHSRSSGAITDFVIANGRNGPVNQANGIASRVSGTDGASIMRSYNVTLAMGTPYTIASWPTNRVIRTFEFSVTTAGTYDITMSDAAPLKWRLFDPGTTSDFRPRDAAIANGVDGVTSSVNLSPGWHAIVCTTDSGLVGTPFTFSMLVEPQPQNPVPALTSISPAATTAGAGGFTLTANGSGFASNATIQWNGAPLSTTFVSASQLTAAVPASLVATFGTASVSVQNPTPGGGISTTQTFTIGHPVPTITGLTPQSTLVGGGAFTLAVIGTGFSSSSVIQWDGAPQPTTYVTSSELTCAIPASFVASAGYAAVTVENPAPGGGVSTANTFTVNNLDPLVVSTTPSTAAAGGPAFLLTVNGVNFVPTSVISFDGLNLATTFVNAGTLTATVPASSIAGIGTYTVGVVNPAPTIGSGYSSVAFNTVNPVPTVTSTSPSSAVIGGLGSFGPQQVLSPYTNGLDQREPRSVYAEDLDGDGDLDVLAAFLHTIGWYENLGDGNFGTMQAVTTYSIPSTLQRGTSVFAIDLDGDNDADVLSASFDDDKIAWYENLGGGTFGPQQVITTLAAGAWCVHAADVDGDGDHDVLSASPLDNKIAWYENTGGGTFGAQQVITTSAGSARSVFAIDVDGDGDTDVLHASQDRIAWYENTGGGSFGAEQWLSGPAGTPTGVWGGTSVFATDLDGDGDRDVLSASITDDKIAWYENMGGGSFGPQQVVSASADSATSVFAADLDGDGDTDVLSASGASGGSSPEQITWYENLGGGSFGPPSAISMDVESPECVFAADLDGDCDMDVLSASLAFGGFSTDPDHKVAWYENGGGAFPITVNGSEFVPSSVISFDGISLATTFVDANTVAATVPCGALTAAGTVIVGVTNPSPGGGFGSTTFTVENPAPAPTSLDPPSVLTEGPTFLLNVNGSAFVNGSSTVRWNGTPLLTAFVSATQLRATVPSPLIALPGTAAVDVETSGPGGGISAPLTFDITNPAPTISSVTPDTALLGSGPLLVTVNGSNFNSTSVVRFGNGGGNALPTTFIDANTVTVTLTNSQGWFNFANITSIGVENPAPGGGSAFTTFTVENPTPTLTSLGTTSVSVGTPGFWLTVMGSQFISGDSTVRWNGTALTTQFISANELRGYATSSLLASAGVVSVDVETTGPGGGVSSSLPFTVVGPTPTTSLGTTFAANSGQAGNMFDLVAINDVSICGFDVNLDPGTWDLEVYTVTGGGTFIGKENDPSAWTLAGAATGVVSNGGNVPTPLPIGLMVSLAAGSTQGFYVTVTNGAAMNDLVGTSPGAVFAADANLQILEGAGKTYPFGATFSPRVWSGAVHYRTTALAHLQGSSAWTISEPCSPFTFTAQAGGWVAVGLQSTSDWDLGVGSAFSQSPGAVSEFVVANGDNGTVSPLHGVASRVGGTGSARIKSRSGHPLTVGTPSLPQNWNAYEVIRLFQFDAPVAGNYNITMSNAAPLKWRLFDPGTNADFRPRGSAIASGVDGVTSTVSLSPGLHAIVCTTDTGPVSAATYFGFTMLVEQVPNPAPSTTAMTPSSTPAGGPSFGLTVHGSGFALGSIVHWNGTPLSTSFMNSSTLAATVPAALIASPGVATVTVQSPAPGGGTSNGQTFTITNPVPAIGSLNPPSAVVNDPSFTLTVQGTGFTTNSVVRWNGAPQPTTYVSSSQLACGIPASLVTSAGYAAVTVENPAPGGGTSAAATFTINNPNPVVTSTTPATTFAGGPAFLLTVDGTNFVQGAVISFDGLNLATTFVNANTLTATVPASSITALSTFSVIVTNPAPTVGSGVSSIAFNTVIPAPTLTSTAPTSAIAGDVTFTMNVNGTGFFDGATMVRWNGTAIPTTYVSNTQVQGLVSAALIGQPGTANIDVENIDVTGMGFGGISGALPFPVLAPVISSLQPAGGPIMNPASPPHPVTIFGANFHPGTVAYADEFPLSTTFISSTELQCQIPGTHPGVQQRGGVAIAVENAHTVPSNPKAHSVGGPASNLGIGIRHPLGPLPGETYIAHFENGMPNMPFLCVVDVSNPTPIYPWPNPTGDFVLSVLPYPAPSIIPLVDGIGTFAPPSGATMDPNGHFDLGPFTLPNPPLGIQITVQGAFINPLAPLGYSVTWGKFPDRL